MQDKLLLGPLISAQRTGDILVAVADDTDPQAEKIIRIISTKNLNKLYQALMTS